MSRSDVMMSLGVAALPRRARLTALAIGLTVTSVVFVLAIAGHSHVGAHALRYTPSLEKLQRAPEGTTCVQPGAIAICVAPVRAAPEPI